MSNTNIGHRDVASRSSTSHLVGPAYVRGIPAHTWQSALRRGSRLRVQAA
jgi:hypothetical protein